MPEKDIRYVLEVVADSEIGAYLACFEYLQEYEWCGIIQRVMEERNI